MKDYEYNESMEFKGNAKQFLEKIIKPYIDGFILGKRGHTPYNSKKDQIRNSLNHLKDFQSQKITRTDPIEHEIGYTEIFEYTPVGNIKVHFFTDPNTNHGNRELEQRKKRYESYANDTNVKLEHLVEKRIHRVSDIHTDELDVRRFL